MRIKIKAKIKEKERNSVSIDTDFIRLDSFLKLCNAVPTGGYAKIIIEAGEVKVNDEVCLQRGKKLRKGDSAEFNNIIYEIK